MARVTNRARIALVLTVTAGALWFPPRAAADDQGARPELSIGRSAQYDYDPPVPGTYQLPAMGAAGDGDVLTANGKRAKLRDFLDGRITILSFIYTRCPDPRACPMATGALYKIHDVTQKDPSLAESLRLVTFSFDPKHDTPQVMADYAESIRPGGTGCEWHFLTTRGEQELQPILASYGQRVDRRKQGDDPLGLFYHVVRVYLIDAAGRIRNIYSFGMLDPRLVVTDVRTLMMETTAEAGR
jgi:cytochrome oxidase Cu insertion factor (SCO1/SenC/PrrC family)